MKHYLLLPILCVLGGSAWADTFFVPNFGINTITKYDASGNASPFTSAFVSGPSGVALDRNGHLYVSTNDNKIEEFAPDGTDLGVFASAGVNNPLGLAFDRAGNLYVANFAGNTVERFAPDGTGVIFALVVRPTGLVFDAAGNLYVANFGNTIEVFAPDATPLGSFAQTGLNNPEGLVFDSLGNLYAANSGDGTIELFSSTGSDAGVFAQGLDNPIGLGVDSAGFLYAVNSGAATIERFGNDVETFASTGFTPAFIAVQKPAALINISSRLKILTGENVLDAGFIILSPGAKALLIRGLGPSLAQAGVSGTLADPVLELHNQETGAVIATNDDWMSTQRDAIIATGIPPTDDAEAALLVTLPAGTYTVIEHGKGENTGVGLMEIYDLSSPAGPRLGNISTRGFVDTGDNVMIAGFIAASPTGGDGSVLVRALGPSLGAGGVVNPLADPSLELRNADGALVAANDSWKSTQETEIEATGIPPSNDAEAAIVATLAPGSYTATERGADGGTGVGLIEVYDLR